MQQYLTTFALITIIFAIVFMIGIISTAVAKYANNWFGKKVCSIIYFLIYVGLISLIFSSLIHFQ